MRLKDEWIQKEESLRRRGFSERKRLENESEEGGEVFGEIYVFLSKWDFGTRALRRVARVGV